jgi:hypothetical protein
MRAAAASETGSDTCQTPLWPLADPAIPIPGVAAPRSACDDFAVGNSSGAKAIALGVAPPVAVACAFAALYLGAVIGGADLVFVLACLVGIPIAGTRWASQDEMRWGLAAGAIAIALVEAFAFLLFLLSRANFN